ncbi:CHASE2 domain-containing protein [Kaarinaea lacus]
MEGLYHAAIGLGVVSVNKDSDGVLRRLRPLFRYQNNHYLGLSLSAIINKSIQLIIKNEKDSINDTHLPLTAVGTLLINQYADFQSLYMSGVLASIAQL